MPPDASSDGTPETMPAITEGKEAALLELFGKALEEKGIQEMIDLRETLMQNAMNIAERMQLLLKISPEECLQMMAKGEFIDKLREIMNKLQLVEGERVRKDFTDLTESQPALIAKLNSLNNFTDKDRESLENIIGHFSLPDASDDGKSYLGTWMQRDAIDGRLVQTDFAALQRIHAPEGTPEQLFLQEIAQSMRSLQTMDPSNLTFVDTSPSLNPGTRFAMSCLLAGFGLFSLLISWKSGRVPIKGLMAIGLLVYLNSNRGSNLSFLSSPRYESLTQKLKGSEGGGAVIEALGESGNQRALNDFAKRERQRVSLPVTQPVTQREDFPESEQSYAILTEELGLGQQAAKILRTMLPSEIAELSRILKGLNAEEKEIFTQFVRRGINVPEAIASIPLTTPGLTVPIV